MVYIQLFNSISIFLDIHSIPIYIKFSSIDAPHRFERASVYAIQASGQSGMVLIGMRVQGKGAETDNIVLMRRGEK
jgi:hypothetical protein